MITPTPRLFLYALFLCSGGTALVYELVWTRSLVLVFGGTSYAVTTVLASFMGGLGLGGYLCGRVSGGLSRPGRVYGVLELLIGGYALCVPFLLGLAEPLYRWVYPHVLDHPGWLTLVRVGVTGVVLVIPTTLMGATLPLLVRYVHVGGMPFGRSVGTLYGINTLGAVLGVSLAGFVLLPRLGLSGTTYLAACVNGLVGLLALWRLGGPAPQAASSTAAPPAEAAAALPSDSGWALSAGTRRWVLAAFAVSGASAMVYEVAWTRALVMSLGSSTYSFTCILSAFILGLALGSLILGRLVDGLRHPLAVLGWLELLVGLSAVVLVPLYGLVPLWVKGLVTQYGGSYGTLLTLEFLLIIGLTLV
ncbi:MAG: fused MFS/spermidine synthase, partial [Phycisphaerae bacterium]